ncbi:hypothetical protein [Rubellicoccus peritrichatus]|uniref:Uncharacterized protein n=1 Tax=Rubellicoccus peritrichatus TaxID=3080537 RepID=A0AAQ3LCG0_9BACT|nr:hypothetical protein [Puniceicoccus sp. CR14]WOO41887.1 hypothetical protein RZN69_02220 [Puniceicoccus sp. CR14]
MPFSRIACFVLISLLPSVFAHAQQKLPVEVSRVNFNSNARPYKWNNIVIQLQANQNPDPQAANPRYVDNITVTLTLGYESKGASPFTFYQAEATLVTLETGKKKEIAFWMPYDVVQRDNLPKEPKYWIVELEVNGQQLNLLVDNKKSFSSGFTNLDSINGFKSQASGKLSETDGILVPTYLSPNPYIDQREPAAFIRKEQQ